MLGFGILAALIAGLGWLSITRLGAIQADTENIYTRQLVPLKALGEIQNDLQRVHQGTHQMFSEIKKEKAENTVANARKQDQKVLERSEEFATTIYSEEVRSSFKASWMN